MNDNDPKLRALDDIGFVWRLFAFAAFGYVITYGITFALYAAVGNKVGDACAVFAFWIPPVFAWQYARRVGMDKPQA